MHYMHYMHYKDYIHHDFYVYSPVLLTQYLGHCWHTPCTELYILRISAWLLRKPPLPCHRGGETIWLGEGGGVGVPAHIYIYITIHNYDLQVLPSFRIVWTVTYEVKEHFSQVTQEQERGRFFCALMVHVLLNMVGKVMVSCTLWWFKIATMYLAILHIL